MMNKCGLASDHQLFRNKMQRDVTGTKDRVCSECMNLGCYTGDKKLTNTGKTRVSLSGGWLQDQGTGRDHIHNQRGHHGLQRCPKTLEEASIGYYAPGNLLMWTSILILVPLSSWAKWSPKFLTFLSHDFERSESNVWILGDTFFQNMPLSPQIILVFKGFSDVTSPGLGTCVASWSGDT